MKKLLSIILFLFATIITMAVSAEQSNIILYPLSQEAPIRAYSTFVKPSPEPAVLNRDLLYSLSPGDPATVIIGGEQMDVITAKVKIRTDGITWSGKLEGLCSLNTIVITVSGDASFGTIFSDEKRFKIHPGTASGIVLVEEENPAFEMPIGDDVVVPPVPPLSPAPQNFYPEALSSSHTAVDLMAYYTPAVESYFGGPSNAKAGIQHLVDLVNEAYNNSQIDLELRLVHIEKVSYPDGGSTLQALHELTDAAGAFYNLSDLRYHYGADLVTLLRRFDASSNDSCGRAWMVTSMTNTSWSSDNTAFSVVQVGNSIDGSGYYCDDLTLAHETGHNFGCAHDRDHAGTSGIFEYSYGYDQPGVFATIMSYDSPRIPFYSNPDITYQGYAIGVPAGSSDAADNARTIRETKGFIASYRPSTDTSCNIDDRIQKIYIAYYQRPGDPDGISYWTQRLNQSGGNLYVVIDPFATSAEAQSLYGQINESTIGNVIDAVYMALFNRLPDSDGKQFYINGFTNGLFTPGSIALNILDGAGGTDLVTINNKLRVANEFTCQVQNQNVNYSGEYDADRARQFLGNVSYDQSSVDTALSNLQQLIDEIKP